MIGHKHPLPRSSRGEQTEVEEEWKLLGAYPVPRSCVIGREWYSTPPTRRHPDGFLYAIAGTESTVSLAGSLVSIGRGVAGQHLAALPAEIPHDVVI